MQTINITAAASDDTADKLIHSGLLKHDIEQIDILNYTQAISELFIVFQCFPQDNPRKVEQFKRLRRKTKILELYLVLDYERIINGTDEEILSYMKEVFIKGCETFLKPMKDFDWEGFYKEVMKRLS